MSAPVGSHVSKGNNCKTTGGGVYSTRDQSTLADKVGNVGSGTHCLAAAYCPPKAAVGWQRIGERH